MNRLIEEKKTINFIVLIRCCAVIFVVWDHLGPFWAEGANIEWWPAKIIGQYINKPLGIIQYFGFLGVVLFFLTSGFIITYVAQRESRKEFILKRFFRIYPPLIFSFGLIYVINNVYTLLKGSSTYWGQFTLKQYLSEMTLMNHIFGGSNFINGVTWSLIIEVIFYFICFILLDYIKKYPKIAISIMTSICFIITLSTYFNESLINNNLIKSISYIPYLIYGQIIYYLWAKKISFKEFSIFTCINYFLMIKNTIIFNNQYYNEGNSYGVSFLYAYLIFIVAILLNNKIKINRSVRFISEISYSLYLNHSTIGGLVLSLAYLKVGFTVAFLCAVILSFFVAIISYNFIEKPIMNNIKKILISKK
ncbi:Acyltransferase family protein [Clostridium butyricum]|uniref:Acyltransferase family protein n=1 Tax=Clostridium butyricum TaxID=1492 RepID=A0A6N3BT18_CLOBU